MKRRPAGLLVTLALAFLAGPLAAEAEQAGKMPRIAILRPGPPPDSFVVEVFQRALHGLGYAEGQNVAVEWRFAEGRPDRFPALAAELIQLKPDVIVVFGDTMARVFQQGTTAIPIVAMADDLLGAGLVASLARPGGNLTGVSIFSPELDAKRLELLKEVGRKISRVAAIWDPSTGASQVKSTQLAAQSLRLRLQIFEVRSPSDVPIAFDAARKGHAGALSVMASPLLFAFRKAIIDLAAKDRLPTIFQFKEAVEDGALMSYGSNRSDAYQQVVRLVDRVLKGAKPADLPVEQPTRFELVINLKTAKALGLTIPPSVLVRADQVIH